MSRVKLFSSFYLIFVIALFLYSFTQVDLGLTLSRNSVFQTLEKSFQYVGFFQRQTSTIIFSLILFFLFAFYFGLLFLAKKQKLNVENIKLVIFFTTLVLTFSYNAFSYDLFNYIFDAKIVTFYHLNPYLQKALDFPNDPMLSFMRWTHRTYPYGPSWLLLTVPLSFIGSKIFLLTFFLFKTLNALFFLGSTYLIYKITEIVNPSRKIFNTVFWSLNPFVLIESLVSSHNDVPMIFFVLLAFYFAIKKTNILSLVSYVFSIGIKFSTALLFPVFIYIYYQKIKKKKINWENIFKVSLLLSVLAVLIGTIRTNFQPWYLLFFVSMASLLTQKYYVFIVTILFSIFSTIIYIPYVLYTDYSKEYPSIILNIEFVGLIVSLVAPFIYLYFSKFKLKSLIGLG